MNQRVMWRAKQVPAVFDSILRAAEIVHDKYLPKVPEDKRASLDSWSEGIAKVQQLAGQPVVEWTGDTATFWDAWVEALRLLTRLERETIADILETQYNLWIAGKKPASPSPVVLKCWDDFLTAISEGKTPQPPSSEETRKQEQDAAISPLTIGLIAGGAVVAGLVIWLLARRRGAAGG